MLRLEVPGDADFLFRLFCANRMGILRLAQIPEAAIDDLILLQHRSQTSTYRSLFPNAVYSIVEHNGEPIGRLIENDEKREVYFVDIALMPEHQQHGFGRALIKTLRDEWAARGRNARAKVAIENEPSMRLFRGLGFIPDDADPDAYVTLRWKRRHACA